jgi:hypothetical protein
VTTRTEIAQAVARYVQGKGGSVTSVVPPRPGESLVFETRTNAQANEIATWLRERGFRVTDLGSVQRLVHNATVEEIEYELERGGKAKRTVTHPGFALVRSFEVIIPAMAAAEIPGSKSPPRPVRGPPIRRRRG